MPQTAECKFILHSFLEYIIYTCIYIFINIVHVIYLIVALCLILNSKLNKTGAGVGLVLYKRRVLDKQSTNRYGYRHVQVFYKELVLQYNELSDNHSFIT